MRGIIVKPKPCCGYSLSLGKVVNVEEVPLAMKIAYKAHHCTRCNLISPVVNMSNYWIVNDDGFIEKNRVKILPDDINDTLEVEKEKELMG